MKKKVIQSHLDMVEVSLRIREPMKKISNAMNPPESTMAPEARLTRANPKFCTH